MDILIVFINRQNESMKTIDESVPVQTATATRKTATNTLEHRMTHANVCDDGVMVTDDGVPVDGVNDTTGRARVLL